MTPRSHISRTLLLGEARIYASRAVVIPARRFDNPGTPNTCRDRFKPEVDGAWCALHADQFIRQKENPRSASCGGFRIKPLAVTYSCMGEPHYHRRMRVSLLSSGWDQVVPRRYGRQGRGGSSALAPAPHLLEKIDPWKRIGLFREWKLTWNKT
jgi:hypothetical protein